MKRKNKISLFPDDRILYVKDPKHSTKNKKCPVITNKQIQQSCRIKNPYTKVNFHFCTLVLNNLERNYETNSIYNNIKKKKIFRKSHNQGSKKLEH